MGEDKSQNKLRLLYVAKILTDYCFRKDTMSATEIREILEEDYEIYTLEEPIRRDIKALIDFGYDIENVKGRGYRLVARPDGLTLDDLIKLRDCIMTSRLYTDGEQQVLINKLCGSSINSASRELLGRATIDNTNLDEFVPIDKRIADNIAIIRTALGVDELAVSGDEIEYSRKREKELYKSDKGAVKVSKIEVLFVGEAKTYTATPYLLRNTGDIYGIMLDYYNDEDKRYESIRVDLIKMVRIKDEKASIHPDKWNDYYNEQVLQDAVERANAIKEKEIEYLVRVRCDCNFVETFLSECEARGLKTETKDDDFSMYYDSVEIQAISYDDYEKLFGLVASMWKNAEIVFPEMAVEGMKGYIQDLSSIYEYNEVEYDEIDDIYGTRMLWGTREESSKLVEFSKQFFEE